VEDIFDIKVLAVAVTYKLWWPLFLLLWRAVDPYPGILTEKDLRGTADNGPRLDSLRNEEWAAWRLRRAMEQRGEQPPALRSRPDGGPGGIRAPLRRLDAGSTGLRRTARAPSGSDGGVRRSRAG
jgi:hypothetical protein